MDDDGQTSKMFFYLKKKEKICVFFHSNEMCGHEGQENESYGCPTFGSAKMIIIV